MGILIPHHVVALVVRTSRVIYVKASDLCLCSLVCLGDGCGIGLWGSRRRVKEEL